MTICFSAGTEGSYVASSLPLPELPETRDRRTASLAPALPRQRFGLTLELFFQLADELGVGVFIDDSVRLDTFCSVGISKSTANQRPPHIELHLSMLQLFESAQHNWLGGRRKEKREEKEKEEGEEEGDGEDEGEGEGERKESLLRNFKVLYSSHIPSVTLKMAYLNVSSSGMVSVAHQTPV